MKRLICCSIEGIEIEGFKSFREAVTCGPLLPGLIAVVGPNGCGKSVVGEAVAFVLGGNKMMMRASSLASLINKQCCEAKVSITITSAELSLKIQRKIKGNVDQTSLMILKCRDDLSTDILPYNHSFGDWKPIKKGDLHRILLKLGINNKAVDRYVVTQSRSAINVEDPHRLMTYLEEQLGLGDIASEIIELERQMKESNRSITDLDEELERLHSRRQALHPEVQKWKRFNELKQLFFESKEKLLQRKDKLLDAQLQRLHAQVMKLQSKESSLVKVLEEATNSWNKLKSQNDVIVKRLEKSLNELKAARKLEGESTIQLTQAQAKIGAAVNSVNRKKLSAKRINQLQSQIKLMDSEISALSLELANLQDLELLQQQQQQKLKKKQSNGAPELEALQQQHKEMQNIYIIEQQKASARKSKEICISKVEQDLQQRREALAEATKTNSTLDQRMAIAKERVICYQRIFVETQASLQTATKALEIHKHELLEQNGSSSLFDKVMSIFAADHIQENPGTSVCKFFGRLQNSLYCKCAVHLTPINAVLSEILNLRNTLVVTDRETAYNVCDAMKKSSAGYVSCIVLDELRKHHRVHMNQQVLLPGGIYGHPMVSMVNSGPEVSGQLDNLVLDLLASWVLVSDRHLAVKVMAAQKEQKSKEKNRSVCLYNVVTPLGEVFKSSGEIVISAARGKNHGSDIFGLGITVVKPWTGPIETCPNRGGHEGQAVQQMEEKMEMIRAQSENKKQAERAYELARGEMNEFIAQKQKLQIQLNVGLREVNIAEGRLNALKSDLKGLGPPNDEDLVRMSEALTNLEKHVSEVTHSMDSKTVNSGSAELISLKKGKTQSSLKVMQRRQQFLKQQLSKQEEALVIMEQEVHSTPNPNDIRFLQSQARKQEKLTEAAEDKWSKLDQESLQMSEEVKSGAIRVDELTSELSSARVSVLRIKDDIKKLQADQAVLRQDLANSAVESNFENANNNTMRSGSGLIRKAKAKGRVVLEDYDKEQKEEPPCKVRKRLAKCGQPSSNDGTIEDSKFLESEVLNVAEEERELRILQQDLEEAKRVVNPTALQEDIDTSNSIISVQANISEHIQRLEQSKKQKEELIDKRHSLMSDALNTINAKVSQVYQYLTGFVGDAYLQYSSDIRMLTSTGVALCVRPDKHRWVNFASLSGGQQALATLALAFSLQAAFPSPFYFLDEVDAALDTLNAERVAQYMLMCSKGISPMHPGNVKDERNQATDDISALPQFIVVSHKPQVFEQASCLVGLYTQKGSSSVVTARF